MGIIRAVPFIRTSDVGALPRPNTALTTYILYTPDGESTGQRFQWSDVDNNYIHIGERDFTVTGTWDASQEPNGNPDYTTVLTTDGNALSVSVEGSVNVNGFNQWNVGDLLVRDNGIYFRIPRGSATLSGLEEGDIPVYKNGLLQPSALSQTEDNVFSQNEFQVDSGTLRVGPITLSERGGFFQNHTDTLGRDYIGVDYRVQESGTDQPNWFPRLARENNVQIQGISTETLAEASSYTIVPSTNSDLYAVELDFAQDYTDLKITARSSLTGLPIKWIPTRSAVENDDPNNPEFVPGVDVTTGTFKMDIGTPLASLTAFNIILDFNKPVILKGDTLGNPYLVVDRSLISDSRDVLDDVNLEDFINAGTGITIVRDGANGHLTISQSSLAAPEVNNFSIDIPSRIDVGQSPDPVNGNRVVNMNIASFSMITDIKLHIGSETFDMQLPTVDGPQSQSVAVSGIDISSATTDNMFVELNEDSNIRSNTQTLRISNLPQQETFYYGVSTTNNPDSVDVSTLTTREVSSTITFDADFDLEPNNWAIILIPSNYTLTDIRDRTFDQSVLNDFNGVDGGQYTQNARVIETQSYDSFVHQNRALAQGILSTSITVGV